MRVLFILGREQSYTRNDVLKRAFERFSQVDTLGVTERPKSLIFNSLLVGIKALNRIADQKSYDLVFIGFYGHLLMVSIGQFVHQPLLFDAFVSTYDTLVSDRRIISQSGWVGRFAYWLDRRACQVASHILLDTDLHADYYSDAFDIPQDKFTALPVGCNEDIFYPRELIHSNGLTTILYYSSYQPLHGVDIVVQAASLLRDLPLRFRLIGQGQEYSRINDLIQKMQLTNIQLIPWMPLEKLPAEIAAADICLGGHFGVSDKASRTIPGKIYQMLAMGRPVVAARSPANCRMLSDYETARLCSAGDPDSLTAVIRELYEDAQLREKIAVNGRNLYLESCSEHVITGQLQSLVQNLLDSR